jgi:hypothetical protein
MLGGMDFVAKKLCTIKAEGHPWSINTLAFFPLRLIENYTLCYGKKKERNIDRERESERKENLTSRKCQQFFFMKNNCLNAGFFQVLPANIYFFSFATNGD